MWEVTIRLIKKPEGKTQEKISFDIEDESLGRFITSCNNKIKIPTNHKVIFELWHHS